MSKENEVDLEVIEEAVDVPEIKPVTGEDGTDTTDWKEMAQATYDLAKKNEGIAKRNKTRLSKFKEQKAMPATPPMAASDLGEKAYLIASGIKGDEIDFTLKLKKDTGKSVEDLLGTTWFQKDLKEYQEKKATAAATPTSSPRSNNSQADTVEYWLAKDELPPVSETDLRRKVVHAKMKKEKSGGVFYNSNR